MSDLIIWISIVVLSEIGADIIWSLFGSVEACYITFVFCILGGVFAKYLLENE